MNRMSAPVVIAWSGLCFHAAAVLAVWRRPGSVTPLVSVNLVTSLSVLGWWASRWYGSLRHGTTWSLSDQALPLYAFLICLLCGVTLTGRTPGAALHWLAFALHAIVLLVAALFLTFFRFGRLF
jgi:hypothetical protein